MIFNAFKASDPSCTENPPPCFILNRLSPYLPRADWDAAVIAGDASKFQARRLQTEMQLACTIPEKLNAVILDVKGLCLSSLVRGGNFTGKQGRLALWR